MTMDRRRFLGASGAAVIGGALGLTDREPAAPPPSDRAYGALGVPVGSLAALESIKATGCTHVVIQAPWEQLQPRGAGTSLTAAVVDSLRAQLDDAGRTGLRVMWENAFHYPPAWVLASVEAFVDQDGVTYDAAASQPGRRVVNWMWTARGQSLVADVLRRLGQALGPSRLAMIDGIKTGGGWYGELHYPPSATGGNAFQGFGASMQTGIGLAPGQVVCPLPGYRPFSSRPRLDRIWLTWYLDGLGRWLTWLIAAHRAAGFAADFHVCHPGYGVRSNQVITSAGYQQAAALGEDPVRMMDVYAADPQVWPYCTWLDTADGFYPPRVDSDLSAWKKIYQEAVRRDKHVKLWGENTGNEDARGMDGIFRGDPRGSALSTAPYILAPPEGVYGYQGIFWLSYASLTAGGRQASLADYQQAISSQST